MNLKLGFLGFMEKTAKVGHQAVTLATSAKELVTLFKTHNSDAKFKAVATEEEAKKLKKEGVKDVIVDPPVTAVDYLQIKHGYLNTTKLLISLLQAMAAKIAAESAALAAEGEAK